MIAFAVLKFCFGYISTIPHSVYRNKNETNQKVLINIYKKKLYKRIEWEAIHCNIKAVEVKKSLLKRNKSCLILREKKLNKKSHKKVCGDNKK